MPSQIKICFFNFNFFFSSFFVVLIGYRSYYRCTNPRCNAKKQVERSSEDAETFIITYEGLHLHFAYPYLLPGQAQSVHPTIKRPKKTSSEAQDHEAQQTPEPEESPADLSTPQPFSTSQEICRQEWDRDQGMGPQGLLEDMVPLMIRNPPNMNTSSNSSSCSSYRSPPTSPSSLSWFAATYNSAPCSGVGI